MTNEPKAEGLIELIERHKAQRSVAEIARNSGGRMTPQRIYSMLSRGTIQAFPKAETIEGLASGMGVPVSEVVLAAARSLGIPAETPMTKNPDDLLIFGAGKLSEESQNFVRQSARMAMTWEGIGVAAGEVQTDRKPWNQDGFDLAADEKREPSQVERDAEEERLREMDETRDTPR